MAITASSLLDIITRVQLPEGEWFLLRTYADALTFIESEIKRGGDRSAEWGAINGEIIAAIRERSQPRLVRATRKFRELLRRLNMLR
jgi:hypothetical protein